MFSIQSVMPQGPQGPISQVGTQPHVFKAEDLAVMGDTLHFTGRAGQSHLPTQGQNHKGKGWSLLSILVLMVSLITGGAARGPVILPDPPSLSVPAANRIDKKHPI